MSCKCFNKDLLKNESSFEKRLEFSKCKCQARLSVSENKRKFYIDPEINVSQIDKIKIDGCLDCSTTTNKCDYLFIYKNFSNVELTYVFVELKGVDIKHAVEQIGCSIDMFYTQGYLKNKRIRGAIVFSTYPKDNGTYRKAKRSLLKNFSTKIKDFKVEEKSKTMGYNPVNDSFH